MANIDVTMRHPVSTYDQKTLGFIGAGSGIEVLGGAAAVVLGILGLLAIVPLYMAAIATIAIGAGILAQGAGVIGRYQVLSRELQRTQTDKIGVGGGLATEFAGGIAGIVLGVLALLSLAPMTLLPVAAIVYGATLALSSFSLARLNTLAEHRDLNVEKMDYVAHQAVNAAAGAQLMVGLGAVVLGILALIGTGTAMTLILVALLAVGCSTFLSGTSLGSRMLTAAKS